MARSILFLTALLLTAIFSVMTTATAPVAYAQDGGGMVKATNKGTLDIRLEPVWSESGEANFNVAFFNPGTESVHQHQDYDFRILKDGQQVFSAANQTGQAVLHNVEGTLTVPYTFQQNGEYTIQVYLAGTGIAPTIPTDEEATFSITVAPEFPAGIVPAAVAASMTTAVLVARRLKFF